MFPIPSLAGDDEEERRSWGGCGCVDVAPTRGIPTNFACANGMDQWIHATDMKEVLRWLQEQGVDSIMAWILISPRPLFSTFLIFLSVDFRCFWVPGRRLRTLTHTSGGATHGPR